MAEDCICGIGFEFFSTPNGATIVNEKAVSRASQYLENELAFEAASPHLGTAVEAVQTAIRRNADNGPPDDLPTPNLTDDFDFLL